MIQTQAKVSTEPQNPNQSQSLVAGLVPGFLAKMCVNNLNKTVARYQLGQFKPDLSVHSFKSQLFGASLQSLGVFKTREILGAGQTDGSAIHHALDFGKNFTAGVVGGLAMHPCCVPFYYMNATPPKSKFLPSIEVFKALAVQNPKVFTRGVGFRAMSTGLEFGVYFTLKSALDGKFDNPLHHELASSLPAILLAVPFHQKYIQAINTVSRMQYSKSLVDAVIELLKPELKAPSDRHCVTFILFTAINMTELGLLDAIKNKIDSSLN